MAEEPAPLGGRIVGGVDRLLNIAAGLGEHLAHLAGHAHGQLFLMLGEQVPEAAEQIPARRGGDEAPPLECPRRRAHRAIHVRRTGIGKAADQVALIGGVPVFQVSAGAGGEPLPGDEVLETWGHGLPLRSRDRAGPGARLLGVPQPRQGLPSSEDEPPQQDQQREDVGEPHPALP